jgi:hypothetical protein
VEDEDEEGRGKVEKVEMRRGEGRGGERERRRRGKLPKSRNLQEKVSKEVSFILCCFGSKLVFFVIVLLKILKDCP